MKIKELSDIRDDVLRAVKAPTEILAWARTGRRVVLPG
jgi:hypothetical protein